MVPTIYERDRIPVWHLVRPLTIGGVVIGGSVAFARLPLPMALGFLFLLLGYSLLEVRRRRQDRVFLSRYFGLDPSVQEVEGLHRSLAELMHPGDDAISRKIMPQLAVRLDELAERTFQLGLAIRKLEGARSLDRMAEELSALEVRLKECQDGERRRHFYQARTHLLQERLTILRMHALREKLEAQLVALVHFFKSAATEVRAISARIMAGHDRDREELIAHSQDILDSAVQIEGVIDRLEGHTVEEMLERAPQIAATPEPTRCLLEGSSGSGTVSDLAALLAQLKGSFSLEENTGRSMRIKVQKLIDQLHTSKDESRSLGKRLVDKACEFNPRADSGLEPSVLFQEALLGVVRDGGFSPGELEVIGRLGEILQIDPADELLPPAPTSEWTEGPRHV